MGKKHIVKTILAHIATIDFTTTKQKGQVVSVFETNIRYLGEMLACMKQPSVPLYTLALIDVLSL